MPVRRLTTITVAALASLALLGCEPIEPTSRSSNSKSKENSSTTKSRATVKITASQKVCWSGKVGGAAKKGCGRATLQVRDSKGTYRIQLRKTKGGGNLTVVLVVDGESVDSGKITASSGVVSISYASQ